MAVVMTVDGETLRMTMRQWATGVTVVTSAYGGERAGMTVSSFTSVALEPPTVLICINKDTHAHTLILRSGKFGISVLGENQQVLSNRFAGFEPDVIDRFEGVTTVTAETGVPLLSDAIAWFDCVVTAGHETYTHTIFIGQVVYTQSNPTQPPLIYHNRGYRAITDLE